MKTKGGNMTPEEIAMAFGHVTNANTRHSVLTEAYRDYRGVTRQAFSAEESASAKRLFGVSAFAGVGGWILPDGTVLDFKMPSYADHAEIFKAFSDRRVSDALKLFASSDANFRKEDALSGRYSTEWKEEALAAGLVRLQFSPTGAYVTLWKAPTPRQLDSIYDFVDACENSEYADAFRVLAVSVGDEYVEYSDVDDFSRRAVNDIKRLAASL